ncbi:hypothetical protein WA158_000998 [Blastocystis sp. Blastoise]
MGKTKCVYNACDATTFIVVCCTLIMSIICTLNTNKTWINKTLWSYSIPLRDTHWSVDAGTIVSVNFDSTITVGGGLTVYKDLRLKTTDLMMNVRTCGLSDMIYLAAYRGGLKALSIDFEEYSHDDYEIELPLTKDEKIRDIDDIICLDRYHAVIIGGGELLPLTVNYTFVDHSIKFTIQTGQVFQFAAGYDAYPHSDTMGSEKSICVTFEGDSNDDSLYTFVATLSGEGASATFGSPTIMKYSEKYSYHQITGLRGDRFVVVAAGALVFHNHTQEAIRCRLIQYNKNTGTMTLGNWTNVPDASTVTYFAVDNFDDDDIVLVYFNEHGTEGMIAQKIEYSPSTESLSFGANFVLKAISGENSLERLKMKMLSPTRFGVFYDDIATENSQGLSFIQGIMTDDGEIEACGGEMTIVEARREPWKFVYYDIAMLSMERFVFVESYGTSRSNYASVSLGVQKFLPIGITSESFFGGAKVNFGGLYYAPDGVTFTPGYSYFTDSRGRFIRGEPVGWNHQDEDESYYINSREDNIIVSSSNLIGYAVATNILMIQTA